MDTIGLFNPVYNKFLLKNSHAGGYADEIFNFGPAGEGWVSIAGDWDGDGIDTIGLFSPESSKFYLKNSHTGGISDEIFKFGPSGAGWIPIAGDWDGQ